MFHGKITFGGMSLFLFLLSPDSHSQVQIRDTISGEGILNFYRITESIGTGGQPTIEQFTDIADANYSVVVNLAMSDSDNAIRDEGGIVEALGMRYVHIPVPWDSPSVDHLRRFFEIMNSLDNDNVFVHCAANYRASVFVHRYLTLQKGFSAEEATSPILRDWLPAMNESWKPLMGLELEDITLDATIN